MTEFSVTGLRVVREAARTGSFSRAAERLGYTQSAISRQVTLMEQAAGGPLFERLARGVRPTAAGRIVLRHADALLDGLDTVRDELRDLGDRPSGRVRVGAFATATAALVPRAMAAVMHRNPALEVRIREGTTPGLSAALARGRIDVAVLSGPVDPVDGVDIAPLLQDSLYVALPQNHPLAGRSSAPPALLRGARWIAGSADTRTTLLGAWAGPGAPPVVAHIARDWVTKIGLVAAGLGVTVVPGLAVTFLPPTVSVVRIDDPDAVRPTVLAYRRGGPEGIHPVAESLRDVAAELAADLRNRVREFA
ncbi:DNA-binding transcriptional LysR family regulator [Nocardia transvalensis]|uniref:DNA-binding transcriptional LysR family regulator n=1 Tax=Nocardia transvalensis TaxID=37333 RepID=A0A7W9ULC9_9NOCA|nr:LysR family transcriptional regulator [Nocardia transvalensis]MBB5917237.1 DNA-binding transcriptional LysR family regulator [Nocardia transvalensis]